MMAARRSSLDNFDRGDFMFHPALTVRSEYMLTYQRSQAWLGKNRERRRTQVRGLSEAGGFRAQHPFHEFLQPPESFLGLGVHQPPQVADVGEHLAHERLVVEHFTAENNLSAAGL